MSSRVFGIITLGVTILVAAPLVAGVIILATVLE